MNKIKEDVFYDEETYSKGLNREDTLEYQNRIIANFYSRGLWDEFEYSLKALLPLLPQGIRIQFESLQHDTSIDGIERHYQMFYDIQDKMESDTNMIWKKKFIKTFQ